MREITFVTSHWLSYTTTPFWTRVYTTRKQSASFLISLYKGGYVTWFFGRVHTFFNVKIARFKVRLLRFSRFFFVFFQLIFIKQSTCRSHIRIWALFINIQHIHILLAVFAKIRSKYNFRDGKVESVHTYMSTTKPTIRLVRPAKTEIRLSAQSDQNLHCAFYSLQAIQRRINKNPCHIGWMHRLIWVFSCHKGLIIDFAVHWLIYQFPLI